MKKLFAMLAVALGAMASPAPVTAATGGPALDTFPAQKSKDLAALQDGARTFVNYCLNCHSASAVRYNRLKEIGLSEEQIKTNLMFATDKIGNQMTVAMPPASAKAYFGVVPPDLSLTARARSSEAGSGQDWIYTYLRSFYRDAERPTGWNNTIFPNVGMPHALWAQQGIRLLTTTEIKRVTDKSGAQQWVKESTAYDQFGHKAVKTEPVAEAHPHEGIQYAWTDADPTKSKAYDEQVANVVAFLDWAADPTKATRQRVGVIVLLFLAVFTFFAWGLNRSYWKDVK